MSRKQSPGPRRGRLFPLLRLLRLIGLDTNPLRRGVDRAEAWMRIALVAAFLVGAPLAAAAVGHWADSATRGAVQAQTASLHQVYATILRTVPASAADPVRGATAWVSARWRAPDGTNRTGEVPAPVGARASTRVRIWVDHSGQVAEPPLTNGQVVSRVVTAVALTPVALALVLAFVLGLAHRLLERRRMLAWESAWTAVEPLWTRRARLRPPGRPYGWRADDGGPPTAVTRGPATAGRAA